MVRRDEKLSGRGGSAARRFGIYLGFFFSAVAIVYLIRTVEPQKVLEEVRGADRWELGLALLCTVLSYVLRSYRWQYFFHVRTLRFPDAFRCLIIGFFMNNVLPARMGELVRAHLGGRVTGESRTTVLASIAGERLADGLTISLIFALLFTIGSSGTEREYSAAIYTVAYLFAGAGLGTLLVILVRHRIFRVLEWLQGRFSGSVSTFTLVRIRRFIEGLEPMLRRDRALQITALSLLIWGVELTVYYLVARAFGESLGIGHLSLFLAAVNFSSLIPAGPAGLGPIEAVATAALAHVGVQRELALAMVVTQHVIQILVVGVPGAFFFLFFLGAKVPLSEESEEDEAAEEQRASHLTPLDGKVSVIIPAFNEEQRISPTLKSVVAFLNGCGRAHEVIVVDDGSADRTAHVVEEFARANPQVRVISYPSNRGKGYAVRTGVLASSGDYVLYNDADGSTPIGEILRLERALSAGADIAIGSRALYSADTRVETTIVRKMIGRVFNAAANIIALPGIADTQCGFKLFRRDVAQRLFSRQRAERFTFDVELLYLARKFGYQIAEVPINWINVPGSKVRFGIDPLAMLIDVMRIRLRDWRGEYDDHPRTADG